MATPLFDRDQRTQLLARAFRRSQRAPAETGHLDHGTDSDFRRKTGRTKRSGTRENNFGGVAHALDPTDAA